MDKQPDRIPIPETYNPEFLKSSVFSNDSKLFRWNERRSNAAVALALGYTEREVAALVGVSDRGVRKWKAHREFLEEVDRLSLMVGIAAKAERMRIAQAAVRDLIKRDPPTQKDLLDWLKYARTETEGIFLGLSNLIDTQEENLTDNQNID